MKPTQSFDKAYKDLVRETEGKRTARPEVVFELPLDAIQRRVAVFQPRALLGNIDEDEAFIAELVTAIKVRNRQPLEALTVWYSGKRFYIVDGHHRYQAYKRAGGPWTGTSLVPVVEFRGTLKEAMKAAVEGNSKSKLPMRSVDRQNSAWKLTCLQQWSKAQIAETTGISTSQVGKMRTVLGDLTSQTVKREFDEDVSPRWTPIELAGWPWRQAQRTSKGDVEEPSYGDVERAARVQRFRAILLKGFGMQISKHPEEFASALLEVNSRIPKRLMATEAWEGLQGGSLEGPEGEF